MFVMLTWSQSMPRDGVAKAEEFDRAGLVALADESGQGRVSPIAAQGGTPPLVIVERQAAGSTAAS